MYQKVTLYHSLHTPHAGFTQNIYLLHTGLYTVINPKPVVDNLQPQIIRKQCSNPLINCIRNILIKKYKKTKYSRQTKKCLQAVKYAKCEKSKLEKNTCILKKTNHFKWLSISKFLQSQSKVSRTSDNSKILHNPHKQQANYNHQVSNYNWPLELT